ncbi:MAG: hypothetical protein AB7L09_15500 [Nitrospira sp.]
MKMARINVQIPKTLKAKVDAQRARGVSASWFVRNLIEEHFKKEQRKPAA